jgi:hypothetical protein
MAIDQFLQWLRALFGKLHALQNIIPNLEAGGSSCIQQSNRG